MYSNHCKNIDELLCERMYTKDYYNGMWRDAVEFKNTSVNFG